MRMRTHKGRKTMTMQAALQLQNNDNAGRITDHKALTKQAALQLAKHDE